MNNMKSSGIIRRAEIFDLARLTEIYNQAVLTQKCTCDMEALTIQERKKWFNEHQAERFPIFVYEVGGNVVGYSTLSPYRNGRKALQDVCEISYYLDFDFHKRGIGSELMDYTIKAASKEGFKDIIAIILDCNASSGSLLSRFGFSKWGEMPQIARFDEVSYSHVYYGRKL